MTDIEQKALALLNEVRTERGGDSYTHYTRLRRDYDDGHEALCRAIEQHEAFKQEVSDAAEQYNDAAAPMGWEGFDRFIIPKPKPDPLHECLEEALARNGDDLTEHTDRLRAALEARGLEIREKGQ